MAATAKVLKTIESFMSHSPWGLTLKLSRELRPADGSRLERQV